MEDRQRKEVNRAMETSPQRNDRLMENRQRISVNRAMKTSPQRNDRLMENRKEWQLIRQEELK